MAIIVKIFIVAVLFFVLAGSAIIIFANYRFPQFSNYYKVHCGIQYGYVGRDGVQNDESHSWNCSEGSFPAACSYIKDDFKPAAECRFLKPIYKLFDGNIK
jgi:hypothetical protein